MVILFVFCRKIDFAVILLLRQLALEDYMRRTDAERRVAF